jgi:excisionase family DNA binding protein
MPEDGTQGHNSESQGTGRKSVQTDRNFEPLLDTEEAASLLKMRPRTLRVKARAGAIPGIQVGKRWRFRASVLNRWLGKIAG